MTHLERLARRVESDSFFLAYWLAKYAVAHSLDDAALGRFLGVGPDVLTLVKLCRAPENAADVDAVVHRFHVNRPALVAVVTADAPAAEPAPTSEADLPIHVRDRIYARRSAINQVAFLRKIGLQDAAQRYHDEQVVPLDEWLAARGIKAE